MNRERYLSDKAFVSHLNHMASKYNSDFLRRVAIKMDFLIEENYNGSGNMETVGRGTSSRVWH